MTATPIPTPTPTPARTTLAMTTLDCVRPREEARFWSELLGWKVAAAEDGYAMLTSDGAPALGFGQVDGWEPPAWPDEGGRKRFHLDLSVGDLDTAQDRCVGLGGDGVGRRGVGRRTSAPRRC